MIAIKLPFFFFFTSFYFISFLGASFYQIDTTYPLHCYLSSKFQNRIMIEGCSIKKIVAAQSEKLSIQMEEFSGQAFISTREMNPEETSISIVSENGVVQDILIHFIDSIPEVVILKFPTEKEELCKKISDEAKILKSCSFDSVSEILSGAIPQGYFPCSLIPQKWNPKKGIVLVLKSKLEGCSDFIYIYEITNTSKHSQTLLECELEDNNTNWIYLENNELKAKQKILGMISVKKYE